MITISISKQKIAPITSYINKRLLFFVTLGLIVLSIISFYYFHQNGLGLSYNDARSHLNIGRRVVEGLKPGLAQIGSVWLPLPHILMIPTIWIDFFWRTGLSGSIISMISFVATGMLIYLYLKEINVNKISRVFAVGVFALNINILYLQSTAMTESLLLATLMAAVYDLLLWHKYQKEIYLVRSAFWTMLTTLIRYEGWFLMLMSLGLIGIEALLRRKEVKYAEGNIFLYGTLAGLGIVLWFAWNLLIFKDPLYFAFGPFSAHAQQQQIEQAGLLLTKGDLLFSLRVYMHALLYNSYAFIGVLSVLGAAAFWLNRKISIHVKLAALALFVPLVFNIFALYAGHSVLFIQGLVGNTWFNVRYGIMMAPAIAIFVGFLLQRFYDQKWVIVGLTAFTLLFSFLSLDGVTLDDARVGSSQKNVSEVSGYLNKNALNQKEFILISAASHDAIIFSSGLPMKRYIHEGTGKYWENAIDNPSAWARWIVMRTNDYNDFTFREVADTDFKEKYELVEQYPFADVYELKEEFRANLITEPILGKQK